MVKVVAANMHTNVGLVACKPDPGASFIYMTKESALILLTKDATKHPLGQGSPQPEPHNSQASARVSLRPLGEKPPSPLTVTVSVLWCSDTIGCSRTGTKTKLETQRQAPDTNCGVFVCACLRARAKEGGEVYGLLNARLTTGGSTSVKPIESKQNGGSVQLLSDMTANNAADSGHNRHRTKKEGQAAGVFWEVPPAVRDVTALIKFTSSNIFQRQANHSQCSGLPLLLRAPWYLEPDHSGPTADRPANHTLHSLQHTHLHFLVGKGTLDISQMTAATLGGWLTL
ncbi:hypothetical protein NQZ68_023765 [Dissostichus eleginoides]|nr:hypothetical protein NQZ68_023765 [Dissostichus eleginoides]